MGLLTARRCPSNAASLYMSPGLCADRRATECRVRNGSSPCYRENNHVLAFFATAVVRMYVCMYAENEENWVLLGSWTALGDNDFCIWLTRERKTRREAHNRSGWGQPHWENFLVRCKRCAAALFFGPFWLRFGVGVWVRVRGWVGSSPLPLSPTGSPNSLPT